MGKLIVLFLFGIICFCGCGEQNSTRENELIITGFNWRLKVPDFLKAENKDEWKKVQESGKRDIEEAYDIELENEVNTIFIFKSQDQSFFEATSEKIKPEMASDYIATCKKMNDIFYNTIAAQFPDAKLDTFQTVQTIDNIPFQTLTAKMSFPNGLTKNTVMFRSLFKDTELTVSIMFSNEYTGGKIIEAFKKSDFHIAKP